MALRPRLMAGLPFPGYLPLYLPMDEHVYSPPGHSSSGDYLSWSVGGGYARNAHPIQWTSVVYTLASWTGGGILRKGARVGRSGHSPLGAPIPIAFPSTREGASKGRRISLEERGEVYKLLGLPVEPQPDGRLRVAWALNASTIRSDPALSVRGRDW
jgi:hypothetical protein